MYPCEVAFFMYRSKGFEMLHRAIILCRSFVAMGLLSKTLSWVRYVMALGFPVLSILPGVHRNIAISYWA